MCVRKSDLQSTYNATGVQICLEAALRPSINSRVKGRLGSLRSAVGSPGIFVASLGGGSAIRRGGRSGDGVTQEVGLVLANKSAELVQLGSLRHCKTVSFEQRQHQPLWFHPI